MAYIDPLEQQRRQQAAQAPAGAPAAGGMAGAAAPTPNARPGTGWVNFGTVLGLNGDAAKGMADTLANRVNSGGQAVQGRLETLQRDFARGGEAARAPGTSLASFAAPQFNALVTAGADVAANARALGQPGGVEASLRDVYGGRRGLSSGEAATDAALAGAAGKSQLQGAAGRWGALGNALGLAGAAPAPVFGVADVPGLPGGVGHLNGGGGPLGDREERERRRRERPAGRGMQGTRPAADPSGWGL